MMARSTELYRTLRRGASCALLLAVAGVSASAQQTPAAAVSPGALAWQQAVADTRAFALALLDSAGLPGLSVAVAVKGDVVYSEGFGFADLENRVPVTPLTRFRIGSVSKSVTSAALGLLLEQGKLNLDAPIQQYVAAFPQKRWPVTVRQVGGHIAGIRHYNGQEMLLSRRFPTVLSSLDIFRNDSLLFEPGTKYSYSSYGWNLLSAVVESVSGEDFLSYMRRHVFEPLALRSLVAEHTDSLIAWRARFYERDSNNQLRNAPYVDNSYKWAGGGFIGNTEDLVRYGAALLRPGLLQPQTVAVLFTSQKLRDGNATDYGIGWGSDTDAQGRRMVSHTGGSVGGRAVLLLYPDQDVVVAMLSNAGHAPMSVGNAARIAAFFLR
jgi:CubicO group peptidase (beta-lactamase class C family)